MGAVIAVDAEICSAIGPMSKWCEIHRVRPGMCALMRRADCVTSAWNRAYVRLCFRIWIIPACAAAGVTLGHCDAIVSELTRGLTVSPWHRRRLHQTGQIESMSFPQRSSPSSAPSPNPWRFAGLPKIYGHLIQMRDNERSSNSNGRDDQ